MVEGEAQKRTEELASLEAECIKGRAECETKATENTAKEINNLRDEIMPKLVEADEKSKVAEDASKDAQQRIIEVQTIAQKHIDTQNNVMSLHSMMRN